ncbi:MAG: hypothetical protein AAF235_10920, partial [Planctomycetota bacterium]
MGSLYTLVHRTGRTSLVARAGVATVLLAGGLSSVASAQFMGNLIPEPNFEMFATDGPLGLGMFEADVPGANPGEFDRFPADLPFWELSNATQPPLLANYDAGIPLTSGVADRLGSYRLVGGDNDRVTIRQEFDIRDIGTAFDCGEDVLVNVAGEFGSFYSSDPLDNLFDRDQATLRIEFLNSQGVPIGGTLMEGPTDPADVGLPQVDGPYSVFMGRGLTMPRQTERVAVQVDLVMPVQFFSRGVQTRFFNDASVDDLRFVVLQNEPLLIDTDEQNSPQFYGLESGRGFSRDVVVGATGAGLAVFEGNEFPICGFLQLGTTPDGDGDVILGDGATLTLQNSIDVGLQGTGALEINEGSLIQTPRRLNA